MGKFNILISIFGVIYLGYSFLFKNTVTIYHKSERMVVLNKEKYLKLQFGFSIVNSIVAIIIGIIATMLNLGFPYVMASVFLFHIINYLLRIVAKRKGHIQYNWWRKFTYCVATVENGVFNTTFHIIRMGILMEENLMIIVTGASATGKTTLSKNLADKFKLPVINKDEIKELLFDCLGTKDEEWAIKLGMSSFELSYLFVRKLCQTGKTFIVEGNFENKYAAKIFSDIKLRYNYKVLQIYCHAQVDVLYDRYLKRDNSGDRHPGHIISISGLEEFKSRVYYKKFKLDIDDIISIDIDTTKFEMVNLKQVYDEVAGKLKFID